MEDPIEDLINEVAEKWELNDRHGFVTELAQAFRNRRSDSSKRSVRELFPESKSPASECPFFSFEKHKGHDALRIKANWLATIYFQGEYSIPLTLFNLDFSDLDAMASYLLVEIEKCMVDAWEYTRRKRPPDVTFRHGRKESEISNDGNSVCIYLNEDSCVEDLFRALGKALIALAYDNYDERIKKEGEFIRYF